ncbi:protease inhibitor I42 family protein [Chishuiella sp.]|uniref:protease inhibitor I42 family protein n=1 Tax=Chishuiella sp. TaxID=1969467 RepID=UPI0028B0B707|nr:protease inhibitor I42 family protein [Chishuiella sp.]
MKKVLLTLGIGAMISSCATNQKNSNTINLDDVKTEKTIHLNNGEEVDFTITTNPTTGYDWTTTVPNDCNVAIVNEAITSDNKTGAMGAPSKKTYKIKANKNGECTIRFDYKRSWEDAVENTKQIKFIVK